MENTSIKRVLNSNLLIRNRNDTTVIDRQPFIGKYNFRFIALTWIEQTVKLMIICQKWKYLSFFSTFCLVGTTAAIILPRKVCISQPTSFLLYYKCIVKFLIWKHLFWMTNYIYRTKIWFLKYLCFLFCFAIFVVGVPHQCR